MLTQRETSVHWLEEFETEHVGVIGNLFIVVPYALPDVATLGRATETVEALARRGEPPVMLLCIAAWMSPPGEAVRPALHDAFLRMRAVLAATSVVAMGQGFMAAAQRAVMTALFTFTRMPNHRVHAQVLPAVRWLEPWLRGPMAPVEVAEQVAARTRAPGDAA